MTGAPAPVDPPRSGPPAVGAPRIEMHDVQVSFGEQRVLRGLDLTVEPGTTFVLMGGSGTGKSVTLKAISGLLRPGAGRVLVGTTAIEQASRREISDVRSRMGFVFQGAALLDWMTALENVALPLEESGTSAGEARKRAMAKLEEVGLASAADKYPSQMSGGMRKRVGFARAVARDPAILLYDEPTTGLDPITTRTIDELIIRARDTYGATGMVVSHDVDSALRVADRIGLLVEGRIDLVATPAEFLESDHPVAREFLGQRDPSPDYS